MARGLSRCDVLTELLRASRVRRRPRIALSLFCGMLAGLVTIQKNSREPTPRCGYGPLFETREGR